MHSITRAPVLQNKHDILDDDHIQWHPPLIGHYTNFWPLLIWTLLPNLTFYLIVQGFHRTYATGAACQQRTLTPPDTWSCPTLGLACVLMSRPISPELVLSPDVWISYTSRYISFAFPLKISHGKCAPTGSRKQKNLALHFRSEFIIWFWAGKNVRVAMSLTREIPVQIHTKWQLRWKGKWPAALYDIPMGEIICTSYP